MTRNTLSQIAAASALAVAALLPGLATAKAKVLPDTESAEVACTDSIRTVDRTINLSYVSCTGSFANNMTEGTLRFGGVDYAFIGKTEKGDATGAGPFEAFGEDFKSGTLTFDDAWIGSFIIGLKAGNAHSFYKFDSAAPVFAIAFDTLGVSVNGGNGTANGLSHVALYGGEPVAAIPEPGTYALMLAGLGAVGFVARRRSAKR